MADSFLRHLAGLAMTDGKLRACGRMPYCKPSALSQAASAITVESLLNGRAVTSGMLGAFAFSAECRFAFITNATRECLQWRCPTKRTLFEVCGRRSCTPPSYC